MFNANARWRSASRVAAWTCVAVLVFLSWIPGEAEVRTGLPGQIEHVIAYAGTGLLAALSLRGRSGSGGLLRLGGGLVLLAGVLEVGQHWVPGRTAQFVDFAASSAGVVLGLLVGAALRAGRGFGRV